MHGALPSMTPCWLRHGAERLALVAPHSDTTGAPAAAAMCMGPLSGPYAAAQRLKIPANSRKLVRPVRSYNGVCAARSVAAAYSVSPDPPTKTVLMPCAAKRSATAAVRSGNHRRLAQLEPTNAAMKGRGT